MDQETKQLEQLIIITQNISTQLKSIKMTLLDEKIEGRIIYNVESALMDVKLLTMECLSRFNNYRNGKDEGGADE